MAAFSKPGKVQKELDNFKVAKCNKIMIVF